MSEEQFTHNVADDIKVPDDLNPAGIELVGIDSNAFSIMGAMSPALKRAGNAPWMIDLYRKESMAGDYDHLIRVAMVYNGDFD